MLIYYNYYYFSVCHQFGGGLKRKAEEEAVVVAGPSSTVENIDDRTLCEVCNTWVRRRYFTNHMKSNLHKNKVVQSNTHELSNVSLINSAFGSRIRTYRIGSENQEVEVETPEIFFDAIQSKIHILLRECLDELTTINVNFIVHAEFVQETKELKNTFDFQTHNYNFCIGDDFEPLIKKVKNILCTRMSEFEKKDSGWSLKKILFVDMNVNKFNPLKGSSFLDLPNDIKSKKAVINVQNNDYQCLKWALLSAMFPAPKNANRTATYLQHQNKLNFANINFPVKITDIKKVEKLNNISINVFGLEYNSISKTNSIVGPLYFTKSRKETHINLLYLTNGNIGHYCFIKNLSRLVNKQITGRHDAIHICDGCLLYFSTEQKLKDHQKYDCAHVVTELPSAQKMNKNWFNEIQSSNQILFDQFQRKLKLPFVVYADFESFLKPISICEQDPNKPFTNNVQEHEVYSYGYYVKCSYDDSLSKYCTYTGPGCAKQFMESICRDIANIQRKICFQKAPVPLSSTDKESSNKTKKCFICNNDLQLDRVEHYEWGTGHFEGVAHSLCSSKYKTPRFVPIFLHNLSNYDAHFIVHALNFRDGEVEIIPQNKEKYISFSKKIQINGQEISLRFLDSFKFMSASLDNLSKNLKLNQFEELQKQFPLKEDFKRLIRKGIFPYEFIKSYESLNATSLPTRAEFYNSLCDSAVSNDDYAHAQDVWNHFKCKTMLDYSNLYLKTDVMLLTDIFENFRKICLVTYDLDPTHYYTAPGLSWDAMLKYTNVKLELLTDFEKVSYIKSGIRGGVSQCSNRYAKANNEYLTEYEPNEPKSYLAYFDANNLYGWAMSQYLPIGDFEWVNADIDFNIPDTCDHGYILEVDLDYPNCLHDSHSDLPLCPENIVIGNCKERKLVPNLNKKTKYIIHYRNLKQCLKLGLQLTKIHRVLKFKQSPWLQKYIDLNTHLRTQAKSDFEKDFYKLMNNAVFGKTMENIEKRVNVKLITHWDNKGKVLGAQSLVVKPEFHSLCIFSENLVAIQLHKTKLYYNKPIYLGFCVLDISKTLMYDFHYNYMKKKFQNNVKLLYTDTDSLIYQYFTENFYLTIKPDLPWFFDTSDYAPNNVFGFPQLNKKKLGYFKDENNGKILKEFVGLRSKMYAMTIEDEFVAKAKGVNKSVTKKMKMENYKTCLFDKTKQYSKMYRFRSIKHVIFTQCINKTSLSYNDSKRYMIPNSTDTLAWGHYSLKK